MKQFQHVSTSNPKSSSTAMRVALAYEEEQKRKEEERQKVAAEKKRLQESRLTSPQLPPPNVMRAMGPTESDKISRPSKYVYGNEIALFVVDEGCANWLISVNMCLLV